ncbi:MAG: hypothetical protein AAGK05_12640, partial [Pseudomonadota bacterium]
TDFALKQVGNLTKVNLNAPKIFREGKILLIMNNDESVVESKPLFKLFVIPNSIFYFFRVRDALYLGFGE